MKPFKKFDVVLIEWVDSCGDTRTWIFEEDFDFNKHDRAMLYQSVGFFIRKTPIATYICESRRLNDTELGSNLGYLFAIPNIAIKTIKKIA